MTDRTRRRLRRLAWLAFVAGWAAPLVPATWAAPPLLLAWVVLLVVAW